MGLCQTIGLGILILLLVPLGKSIVPGYYSILSSRIPIYQVAIFYYFTFLAHQLLFVIINFICLLFFSSVICCSLIVYHC